MFKQIMNTAEYELLCVEVTDLLSLNHFKLDKYIRIK